MIRNLAILFIAGLLLVSASHAQECLIGSADICEGNQGQASGGGGGGLPSDETSCNAMAGWLNPTEATTTDNYFSMLDHGFSTVIANEDSLILPVAFTFSNFSVTVLVAPGGAANDDVWQITLLDDGVATAVTCDITGTETSCAGTDLTHSAAALSRMVMLIDSSTGVSAPTGTTQMHWTLCMDET
jgi:hypothetical protein